MSKNSHSDAEDILSELETQSEESERTKPEAIQESKTIEESNTKTIEESNTKTIEESNTKTINEKKDSTQEPQTRNTIPIGKKPIMTYVNSTLTQLSSLPLVTIRARGKSITTAVDVSQFILKRMNSVGYKISDVRISSDLLESNDGKKRNVSSIEIDIMRV